jgi:hypothetical protein
MVTVSFASPPGGTTVVATAAVMQWQEVETEVMRRSVVPVLVRVKVVETD